VIRTLIVDDEPLARTAIRSLLMEYEDFQIVAEAGHGDEAIRLIRQIRPDLVFLDVQMPGCDGLSVIECLGSAMPASVFVTAYDQHAIKAFEADAIDYLLKPFDDRGFARVIARVRRRLADAAEPGFVVARLGGVRQIVSIMDIDRIHAADGYAEVFAHGRTYLIEDSLAALAERLPSDRFARIHRKTIVQLDRIREFRLRPHGDGELLLRCGALLRVSRRYRAPLDRHLGS
jgi:two-component system, LytTR family, response regulator